MQKLYIYNICPVIKNLIVTRGKKLEGYSPKQFSNNLSVDDRIIGF